MDTRQLKYNPHYTGLFHFIVFGSTAATAKTLIQNFHIIYCFPQDVSLLK